MNELVEKIARRLGDCDSIDFDTTIDDVGREEYRKIAREFIALITEACVEVVKTLGYPEDEIYAEAIRTLAKTEVEK